MGEAADLIGAAGCASRVCCCSSTSAPRPACPAPLGQEIGVAPSSGMQKRGSPSSDLTPRLQLCPPLSSSPPAAGLWEGFRGAERKIKERKSRQTVPSGGPAAIHPSRRPVSAGTAGSGPPALVLGSAGPHARPAWIAGPATATLDGLRTKVRARPDPSPTVPPVRRRREPQPNLTGVGGKPERRRQAGSPAVPPALHDPVLPTHTGKREPEL